MLAALQPSSFREDVRAKATWDGFDKDLDQLLQIMDNFMVKWKHHEQLEMPVAGQQERGWTAGVPCGRLIKNRCVSYPLLRRMLALWLTTPKGKVPPTIKKQHRGRRWPWGSEFWQTSSRKGGATPTVVAAGTANRTRA